MIIYKDLISGDELFSDIYKITEVEGLFYEVEGRNITMKADGIDDSAIGGNASAEGVDAEDGAVDGNCISGINLVLHNRLVETGFAKKKDYQIHIKGYILLIMEKMKDTRPEDVGKFKETVGDAFKKVILSHFKDLQFFMGESCNPAAMNVPMLYKGDTPFFYFFKDGLIEEKV